MDWLSPLFTSLIVVVLFLAPVFFITGVAIYTKRLLSKDRVSPLGSDLIKTQGKAGLYKLYCCHYWLGQAIIVSSYLKKW